MADTIFKCRDAISRKGEIIKLVESIFGKQDIIESDFFDWLNIVNPNGRSDIFLASTENEKLTGIVIGLKCRFVISKHDLIASQAVETGIHPQHRKRGLFKQITENWTRSNASDGIDFSFVIPNEAGLATWKKIGYDHLTNIPLLVRPVRFSNYFDNSVIRKIVGIFDVLWKADEQHDVKKLEAKFDKKFEDIYLQITKRGNLIQKRSCDYLNWRYFDHPTRKYETYLVEKENKILGYIITRTTKIEDKDVGIILDFIVDQEQDYHNIGKQLLKKIIHEFWKREITLVGVLCLPNMLEYKILKSEGFFICPKRLSPHKFSIAVKDHKKKHNEILDIERWHLMTGDWDAI